MVLRFHNAQVFNELTGVLETLEPIGNYPCSR